MAASCRSLRRNVNTNRADENSLSVESFPPLFPPKMLNYAWPRPLFLGRPPCLLLSRLAHYFLLGFSALVVGLAVSLSARKNKITNNKSKHSWRMENGKSKTHLHAAGSFKSTRTFSPAARSRPAIERLVPLKEENNKRKNTGLVVQHYRGGGWIGASCHMAPLFCYFRP